MKILVTGYNGQLGFDVVNNGLNQGFEMIGTTREELDITDRELVTYRINKIRPDAIIHCAAYTNVDKAEDDQVTCWDVNVNGTANLAEAAKKTNSKFMYISSDYVFDGCGVNPHSEKNDPNPINYYGLTKFEGEKVVQSLLEDWFIVRISWVFGINGNNFIKTMIRLAERQKEISIVTDQIGSPTYTYDLANLLISMIQTEKYGIYHATNEGYCNWAQFAREIFSLLNAEIKINQITSDQYPTRAIRPRNSRLSKQNLLENNFKPLPKWENAIKHYLNALKKEVK